MSTQAVAPGGIEAPAEAVERPCVVFFGPLPQGADELAVEAVTADSPTDPACARADVIHVSNLGVDLASLRRRAPRAAIVVDLGEDGVVRRRHLQAADMVIVSDTSRLRQLGRGLARRAVVLPAPLDLDRHAPLEQLKADRKQDARVKRFRRLHRLVGPTVLFAGPYTPDGALDALLDAVYAIREHIPELRVAAVPHGPIDEKYLARCERRALGLGHHGIVEWSRDEDDLPLWYALATVVCSPGSADLEPARLAAAAARPYIASEHAAAADRLRDGRGGFVIPVGEPEALQAALEAVVGDPEEAIRLGRNAREDVERELAVAAYAERVRAVWEEAVEWRASGAQGMAHGR